MLVKFNIKELEAMKNVMVKAGKVMDEETSISLSDLQDIVKSINKTNLMNVKFDIVNGLTIWINPEFVCDIYDLYGDLITGTFLILKNPIKRLMEFYEDFECRFSAIAEKYEKKPEQHECKCKKKDIEERRNQRRRI